MRIHLFRCLFYILVHLSPGNQIFQMLFWEPFGNCLCWGPRICSFWLLAVQLLHHKKSFIITCGVCVQFTCMLLFPPVYLRMKPHKKIHFIVNEVVIINVPESKQSKKKIGKHHLRHRRKEVKLSASCCKINRENCTFTGVMEKISRL